LKLEEFCKAKGALTVILRVTVRRKAILARFMCQKWYAGRTELVRLDFAARHAIKKKTSCHPVSPVAPIGISQKHQWRGVENLYIRSVYKSKTQSSMEAEPSTKSKNTCLRTVSSDGLGILVQIANRHQGRKRLSGNSSLNGLKPGRNVQNSSRPILFGSERLKRERSKLRRRSH